MLHFWDACFICSTANLRINPEDLLGPFGPTSKTIEVSVILNEHRKKNSCKFCKGCSSSSFSAGLTRGTIPVCNEWNLNRRVLIVQGSKKQFYRFAVLNAINILNACAICNTVEWKYKSTDSDNCGVFNINSAEFSRLMV